MSQNQEIVVAEHSAGDATLKKYVIGFTLSIVLTLTAYLLTIHKALSTGWVVSTIVGLALVQFFVQMFYFLHLGSETKPRWKLFVLIFMIIIVLILVFGTIWIMNNLNYRMTPGQVNTYLNNQGGGF